jgi:16S rRNA (adenine1518-N6/adenine1519-N6)-dimethyltransferase
MTKSLASLPSLETVISAHGLATRKSLGQHFLLNPAITNEIVRYAGDVQTGSVIEVGPGPGGLTRSLLAAGATVYAIEKDERCMAILTQLQEAADGKLYLLNEDALTIDMLQFPAPRRIVANLPYNVGTELLVGWLHQIYKPSPPEGDPPSPRLRRTGGWAVSAEAPQERRGMGGGTGSLESASPPLLTSPLKGGREMFESLTLMFQKEVAERIVAEPGNKDFGRLTVLAQFLCDVRYDMELPPEAFSPPPKVSSAVVTLTPRVKPLVDVPIEMLEKVVAAAFGQRRKMLRSALKSLGVDTEKLLADAGIDPTKRAEQLDVATLCQLAKIYAENKA